MLTTFAVFAASVSLGGSIRGMVAAPVLPIVGIAGSRFAVQCQSQNLTDGLIGILGGRESLPIANRKEQILTIR